MAPATDVVHVGLGLLAFLNKDLRKARKHFLTALKLVEVEAEASPTGRLKYAACALHGGHTAIFMGHAGEAKLLLAAAEQSLSTVGGAFDAVTSYALQHGHWFAHSLRSIEAERRGDYLLAEKYRRTAEELRPTVSVTLFLRLTLDTSSGGAAYAALALMQDDPAALVAALTESARPLSAGHADQAAKALGTADAIFSELKKEAWTWPIGELYLAEGRAHVLRALGRHDEAALVLEAAESPSLSRSDAIDEIRTLMLVERSRLLMELGKPDEAIGAIRLILNLPDLSPPLRRIALHEKAEWQADEESSEAAIHTLESARSLGGDVRWEVSTLVRLANLNLRIGLLILAESLALEAKEIIDSERRSPGKQAPGAGRISEVVLAEYPSLVELADAAKVVIGEAKRIRALGRVNEAHNAQLLKDAYDCFAAVTESSIAETPNALSIQLTAKLGMGAVAAAIGRNEEAHAIYWEVVRATDVQDRFAQLRRIRRDAEVNLAALAYRTGDLRRALEWSSAMAETTTLDRSQRALYQFLLAAAKDALGDTGAIEDYRRAQEIYESISETLRPEIVGNFQEAQTGLLYARLARALAREGKSWEALAAAEAGRAQGLARRVRENAQLPPLNHSGGLSAEQLADLARSRPDTLFLFWQILEIQADSESMLLFSLCGERIEVREMTYQPSLRLRIYSLREALRAGSAGESFIHLAKGLYRDLLASDLEVCDPQRITIVPDGPLHELPWGTLLDGHDRFLLERLPFSLLPSLGTLGLPNSSADCDRLLRIAYDPFPNGFYRDGRLVVSPIPQVYEEARLLGSIWSDSFGLVDPPPRVRTVTDALTKGVWKAALFSVHGRCHLEDGLKSALVLQGDEGAEVAFFEAWQIASTSVNCRLVFLSACDTGRGRQTGTEGLLGLAWAFRAAGCGATVATLWPVADRSMPALVARFFAYFRGGQNAADALRQACLDLLNGDDSESLPAIRSEWRHPFFWSAVQIWGEA
ncbi:MAG: CHAT domain-containing protein [Armatimonadetes bacterium]|nr:CHAT domain-containing protein [Armatimonadota bacterium]